MTRATWNGVTIAESDDIMVVDGYDYFPRDSVDPTYLRDSDNTSVCGWKGEAHYFSLLVEGAVNCDAAWYYPRPKPAAELVRGRIGFWRDVKIEQTGDRRRSFLDRMLDSQCKSPHPAAWYYPNADTSEPRDPNDAEQSAPASVGRARLSDRLRRRRQPLAAPHVGLAPNGRSHVVPDVDDTTFEQATEGRWTIVDFFAPWCAPCRAFHPLFNEIAAGHDGQLHFARCDVDVSPRTSLSVGILSIPTLVVVDPDGNEADRIIGIPKRRELDRLIAQTEARAGVLHKPR
jgi:uncharacterized protein (DUF427 family)/thiol-disulfide isomerase/thioredoxin